MQNHYIYKIENNRIVFSFDFDRYVKTHHYVGTMTEGEICKKSGLSLPIPINITGIKFWNNFNQKIFVPTNIKSLEFGDSFNREFVSGPCLNTLTFGREFNNNFKLGGEVRELRFGYKFNRSIRLNPNLRILHFGDMFNSAIILNRGLRVLHFGNDYNKPIVPNISLEKLVLGIGFNQPIVLNSKMKWISFGCDVNKPVKLNRDLIFLSFESSCNQQVILPKKLIRLQLNNTNTDSFIPKFVKYLTLSRDIYSKQKMNKRLQAMSIYEDSGYTFFLTLENIKDAINEGFDVQIRSYKTCKVTYDSDSEGDSWSGSYNSYNSVKPYTVFEIDNLPNSIKQVSIGKNHVSIMNNLPSSMHMKTRKTRIKYNISKISDGDIEFNYAHSAY